MAEFFFNRHVDSDKVEPFSNYKYSKQDGYYNFNPNLICTGEMALACDTTVYNANDADVTKQTKINNCLCKYKKNVDAYLVKKPTNDTTNGITNDNSEKYSEMMLKNINLGIGLGLMMIYIYTTNY